MGFGELLWLFFMISALQPVIRQKMLEASRLRLLTRLQHKRKSRVIALVHRQETMSFLGFPIDLIVHTPGGLVLAAGQIAHALKRHRARVTVFVPHYAMSGGTLLALAADEIVMDSNAVLGPLDPQVGNLPAASILEAVTRKETKDIDDQTLILADVSRKAILQLRRTVLDLLIERRSPDDAQALADKLTTGTWTHDYGITAEEAKTLGLPVSTDMPDAVYEFMRLFPQPTRTQASVQYIPLPFRMPLGEAR